MAAVSRRHGEQIKCCKVLSGRERGREAGSAAASPWSIIKGEWLWGCCSHRKFETRSYVILGHGSDFECSLSDLSYLEDYLYSIFFLNNSSSVLYFIYLPSKHISVEHNNKKYRLRIFRFPVGMD